MFNKSGFTLIEVAVGLVVGVTLVLAVGLLSENVLHQRISADSNSAAMSIAEKMVEQFIASPPAAGTNNQNVDETGTTVGSGAYHVLTEVTDNTPQAGMKKVHVKVTHNKNPYVTAELYTYLKP